MVKATTSTETAAAFILRLYGIGCVAWGLIALWFALTIKAGTQGVVDWTRLWPELTLFVMLGFSVFLLLRWLVVAFSILSASCGNTGRREHPQQRLRFYRSLRAVKVLLAALRSTLTVLAPQEGGPLSVRVGKNSCCYLIGIPIHRLKEILRSSCAIPVFTF